MQALILAAGWATRMGDLARHTPKSLLPIGDRCSLDIAVERIEATGRVHRIHVVTHQVHFPMFIEWSTGRTGHVPVTVHSDGTTAETDKLGSIGDIKFFLDLAPLDDDLLIVAPDNVFDFDITPLLERARHEPVIGLYDVGALAAAARYGVVELDAAGYITSFVEKPPHPTSTLVALAVYGFPATCLTEIDTYLGDGGSPDAMGSFIEWLHKRRPVAGWVFSGRWIDIGSPAEYARVQSEFGGERRDVMAT